MRKKKTQMWVNPDLKQHIKLCSVRKGKPILDLNPNDLDDEERPRRDKWRMRL